MRLQHSQHSSWRWLRMSLISFLWSVTICNYPCGDVWSSVLTFERDVHMYVAKSFCWCLFSGQVCCLGEGRKEVGRRKEECHRSSTSRKVTHTTTICAVWIRHVCLRQGIVTLGHISALNTNIAKHCLRGQRRHHCVMRQKDHSVHSTRFIGWSSCVAVKDDKQFGEPYYTLLWESFPIGILYRKKAHLISGASFTYCFLWLDTVCFFIFLFSCISWTWCLKQGA